MVLLAVYPDVSASGATFAVLPEADGEIGAFTLEVADVVNTGVVGKTALVDVAIEGLMRLSIARKRPAVLDFGFSGRSKDSGCGGDREAGCDHPGSIDEEVDGFVGSLPVDDLSEFGHWELVGGGGRSLRCTHHLRDEWFVRPSCEGLMRPPLPLRGDLRLLHKGGGCEAEETPPL